MLKRNPKLLTLSMYELIPKKEYLFQSLGGSPEMLRHCPKYLTYNLETYIIPRAEFLRALGKDPLENGLSFLVDSKEKQFVEAANTTAEVFSRFRWAFNAKFKDKLKQRQEQVREVKYPAPGKSTVPAKYSGKSRPVAKKSSTAATSKVGTEKVGRTSNYRSVLLDVKTTQRSAKSNLRQSDEEKGFKSRVAAAGSATRSVEDDLSSNSSVAEMSGHRDW